MRLRFADKRLQRLYEAEEGVRAYPAGVIDAFFAVLATLAAALDERDLYALRSLRLEKLTKGDLVGLHSLRLNRQFRLIVEFSTEERERVVTIRAITDYH